MRDYVAEALGNAGSRESAAEPTLQVTCVADVRAKPVGFLWKFWLALGKTTALAGNGGEGKSTILCDWTARATTGEAWPDGSPGCSPCSVLMLAAEDDLEDTLKPRLIAAGADTRKVFTIQSVRTGEDRRSFCLQDDLRRLEQKIIELGNVKLVIIDPISSYLGRVDSHKNAEVRSVLEPLGEMAARLGVAVVCNNHFSKGGGDANSRIIGSVAFVNHARAAFIVTPDAENEGRRLLMPSKMNIAPIKHGLAYRIESCLISVDGQEILTSRIAWESTPVTISADEALAAHNEDGGDRSAASEAEEFLRDKLSAGPVAAKDGEDHARNLGIARRTLMRARKKLGVIAEKDGNGGWTWRLPEECQVSEARVPNPTRDTLGTLGTLQAGQGLSWAENSKGAKGANSGTWHSCPAHSAPAEMPDAPYKPSESIDALQDERASMGRESIYGGQPAAERPKPASSTPVEMPDLPPFLNRRLNGLRV